MATIGKDLYKAKVLLETGEVIGLPTETVYGLAANALNPIAVAKVFEVKNRPGFDPLIIHTDSLEKVRNWVEDIPLDLELLLKEFSPGPLTVLLPKKDIIPDLVTSGLSRVAVRIPKHSMALELLAMLDFPLAAPSANPFGYISPTSAKHVDQQLGSKIPYILDGGNCDVGLESTIVGFEGDQLTVYRKGGLEIEKIESHFGTVDVKEHSTSNPAAPGMLKSHYAPNKEVELMAMGVTEFRKKTALLSFSEASTHLPREKQFILSEEKNLSEAASKLFEGLRYLDALDVDTIYLELVPDVGIGRAINDRLKRAAAKG